MGWTPGGSVEVLRQWPNVDRRPFLYADPWEPNTWDVPVLSVQCFCLFFVIHVCSTVVLYLMRRHVGPNETWSAFICAGQEVGSGTFAFILGIIGVKTYVRQMYDPLQDNLFDEDEGSRMICEIILAMQAYTTMTWLCVPAMRNPLMLMHHASAGFCATQSLMPYLQGYAPFFYGVVEISNWSLCIIDFMNNLPYLKKGYPDFYSHLRVLFAVKFIILRLILWTYMAALFWSDSIALLRNSERPIPYFPCYVFLVSNILLTGLQWVWGRLVLRGLYKKFFQQGSSKGKAAKEQAKREAARKLQQK